MAGEFAEGGQTRMRGPRSPSPRERSSRGGPPDSRLELPTPPATVGFPQGQDRVRGGLPGGPEERGAPFLYRSQ